jgi:alanine racemase
MSYRHLNCIEIDLGALRRNLEALKGSLASPDCGIMAVVKSDAYGHGLLQVAKTLEKAGVWGFGISEIEEAATLRNGGTSKPIVLLSGLCPGAEEEVFQLDLIPGVTEPGILDALERVGAKLNRTRPVHLKADTGMGRLGLSASELLAVVEKRGTWPHLDFTGLYSHLSSADEPADPLNRVQIEAFRLLLREAGMRGWTPKTVHVANSAGVVHFPSVHFDVVRPGLALYGAYPGPESQKRISLRPVMGFKSRVIGVREVGAGSPIGYGHSFVTERPTWVAVVPVGYDDGYLRSLSNSACVLIRGTRCPVIGRVCMKALMVDVSALEGVGAGEEVVLLGTQGDESISVEELARWGDTISYELLCLLGSRNRRTFREG